MAVAGDLYLDGVALANDNGTLTWNGSALGSGSAFTGGTVANATTFNSDVTVSGNLSANGLGVSSSDTLRFYQDNNNATTVAGYGAYANGVDNANASNGQFVTAFGYNALAANSASNNTAFGANTALNVTTGAIMQLSVILLFQILLLENSILLLGHKPLL